MSGAPKIRQNKTKTQATIRDLSRWSTGCFDVLAGTQPGKPDSSEAQTRLIRVRTAYSAPSAAYALATSDRHCGLDSALYRAHACDPLDPAFHRMSTVS